MSDYLTTDIELTSIANAVRTKGGTSAQLEFPTGFVSAIGNLPCGHPLFTKVYETAITVNTTSTATAGVNVLTTPALDIQTPCGVYVCVRDPLGYRSQYHYGTDSFTFSLYQGNSYSLGKWFVISYGGAANNKYYVKLGVHTGSDSTAYGIYGTFLSTSKILNVSARYNSSYSKTMNGTFNVTVYQFNWMPGDNPWTAWPTS